ncbi:hypothetical protein VOLCADRAFT_93304 [Volvox carteri f. nagariensis]|uniref:5'-3' exonuclease domain-containing protein n=1 Tax=Volvox carteri f. nagariensis TaxID=3068 RepID=D8U1S6_VOLCA|nr:uncharacterized protein VOLCADRAFT_93304 [Volvox carteri f. nagariensis]EFJ46233.1 hypothetical protein VOLCADRAFT_93304 [Volvox carteri f. nagariensis]|eukprot:XP_002952680.1 hypothetical protein VOLCADRAFT_93304 [Volvox carteri f. nagariensis]
MLGLALLLARGKCTKLYVVFDNKRGSRSHPHVPDIRRIFSPNYLKSRHAKLTRKQQQQQESQSGSRRSRIAGQDSQKAALHNTTGAVPSRTQQLHDTTQLRKSCEALMDKPPPHLAGFVQVVRQVGGLALYGLPGHEADDLIASLVAGLLPLPPIQAGGSEDTAGGRIASTAAAASSSFPSPSPPSSSSSISARPTDPLPRVVVISADSDMLQLLAYPGCCWLEQQQQQATLLPPAAYPDFLALVGKAEAGVPGVGLGSRASKKLLARYGSISGIIRAYDEGILDGTLRVVCTAGARPGAARGMGSTDGSSSGGSGGGSGEASYPPAVRQALQNIQVTRMLTNLESVPWERVRAYQAQRRREQQQQEQQKQGEQAMQREHEEQLHGVQKQSRGEWQAPFSSALAEALQRHGLICRTAVIDESYSMYDIVSYWHPAGMAECPFPRDGGLAVSAAAITADATPTVATEATQCAAVSAAVEVTAAVLMAMAAAGKPPPLVPLAVDGDSVCSPSAIRGPLGDKSGDLLYVCILAPWDFKYELRDRSPPSGLSPEQSPTKDGPHNLTQRNPQQPRQQQQQSKSSAGAPVMAGQPANLAICWGVLCVVYCTTDKGHVGLAALRPSTGWRLKRLQRRAAASGRLVAVVPFYELLEEGGV